MADQTGEYNLKYTGTVVNKTADGQVQQVMTYEGAGTGFPVILGSLIFTMSLSEAAANSGSCSWAGRGVLDLCHIDCQHRTREPTSGHVDDQSHETVFPKPREVFPVPRSLTHLQQR